MNVQRNNENSTNSNDVLACLSYRVTRTIRKLIEIESGN